MNARNPMTSRRLPVAALAAFAATLFAAPVSSVFAQSFPQYPLQTGGGVAEPNILFILDDSGSMSFEDMPNPDLPTVCRRANNGNCTGTANIENISDEVFTSNTVYYNPGETYRQWLDEDGVRMTGGDQFTSVYGDFHLASGTTLDLRNAASCGTFKRNSTNANTVVCGGTKTFYLPVDPTDTSTNYLRDSRNYYRYQIRNHGGTPRIIRSRLQLGGGVGTAANTPARNFSYGPFTQTNTERNYYFGLGAGESFTAATAANNGNSRMRVYDVGGNEICDPDNNGSNESCTITNTDEGVYRVRIQRDGNNNINNLTFTMSIAASNGCANVANNAYAWGGCSFTTPSATSPTRDEANEVRNYAIWWSYHRTRMKIAKAGASEAFNPLGDNVRVGYRTIWNRSNYNIPVGDGNAGRFEGTARDTWFSRMLASEGSGGTPLHGALQGAGEYFSDDSASGPYGPETGEDQLNCRQNFAILTTDGYWNNFSNYDSGEVGEQDGVAGTSITHPKTGVVSNTYDVAHPFRDGANNNANNADTLADVAMRYWKNDLMPDMGNFVEPTTSNPAFWQHMVTFGISIGLKGTVDQTSVADVMRDGRPRINGNNVNWPNPNDNENAERIDDLLHAAVNGRGEFIAATSADRFRDALSSVLGQIQARLSSGSNVAINSTTFQDGSRIYQATYYSLQWTGELAARDISEAGGIAANAAWTVNGRINARNSDNNNSNDYHQRTVLTWGGTAGAAFPTATQLASLGRSTGTAPVTAANNAAYIKGLQSLEQSRYDATTNPTALLRNRQLLLGDIINSSPFYIRDTETLYVGANDGMLHAINALTGDIQFSYVPAGLNFSRLAAISDPAYPHAFFVDGPVVVSPRSLVANTNYLLGSLGRGGKGVFALNVSAPATMASGNVMWDKTAAADNDMGHVLGTPLILRGNNDVVMAIVANGIDSTNGSAVLYLYNMATGVQIAKIDTGATGGNGLSAPRAADTNNDGKVDYVYAGDLLGNVWKFDLTAASPASWNVAYSGSPLFVAMDEDGNRQPISGGLALAREYGTENVWVTFGTGRMISTDDLDVSLTGTQSIYGLIDGTTRIEDRDDLTEREIVAWGETASGQAVRAFEEYEILPEGSRGWYIDLGVPTEGERVVGGPLLYGRVALLASIIPTEGEGCEPRGAGYLNAFDLFTGTSLSNAGGTGSASAFDFGGDGSGDNDTFTDANGNTFVIGSIDLGLGMPTDPRRIGNTVVICGSGGVCADPDLADPPPGGGGQPARLSWRELISGE